jgi:hypothetical protein
MGLHCATCAARVAFPVHIRKAATSKNSWSPMNEPDSASISRGYERHTSRHDRTNAIGRYYL